MVDIRSLALRDHNQGGFLQRVAKEVESLRGADFAILFGTTDLGDGFFKRIVTELGCPLIGGTSCQTILTSDTSQSRDVPKTGLLIFRDEDGDYGTGVATLGDAPAEAARRALYSALESAHCAGQLPSLIWIYQAPGCEELVIEGLRSIVGDNCPIIGGSSADNDLSGKWLQFSNQGVHEDSVVIGVLFPSGGIGFAFGSGYMPTGKSGRAGMRDQRCIETIDDRPAAEVYNDWTGGALNDVLAGGGTVLEKTTLFPLGIEVGNVDGVSQYALVHPESVTDDKSLKTFANVPDGTTVTAMSGNTEILRKRLGRVALEAKEYLDLTGEDIAGALAVYCAGCMLSLNDQRETIANSMSAALPNVPYLGTFTFGEQGYLAGKNIHGNLMISVVLFGT